MDGSGRNDRPWILDHCHTNSCYAASSYCMQDQTGHGEGFISTGVTSTAYPDASVPGPSFHTPLFPKIYKEGTSFNINEQGSAYANPSQVLSCDYTSQVPATVSENVLCYSGGNQDMGAYPASAPAEQWDTQAVPRPMFYPASHMEPPCVASSPLKNKVPVIIASPEPSIVRGNVTCDTGWNQDIGAYPAYSGQRDAQVDQGPILSNTGDKQLTSVGPLLFEDKTASTVSTPKGPIHNTDRCCPICATLLGRRQDRKRHILSHLPHWLQCQVSGCSWRGDRWELLRKHHLKVHPSSCQKSDTRGSIIYEPWPLVEGITDNATFENAKTIAISLVEKKAKELKKLDLWEDLWGRRRRRSRRVYSQFPR